MDIRINHPYLETPYDILSAPGDSELKVLPMDFSHKEIKIRFPKLVAWWAKHPNITPKRTPKDLAKALDQMGFPGRIEIDVFLCTTLDKAGDFDALVKQQENLPLKLSAPTTGSWESGLEPWQESPTGKITLEEIEISQQHNYDDPQTDLYEVRFDS